MLPPGDYLSRQAAHVLDSRLLFRHELRVGEDGDLRTHSIPVIGEVDQFAELPRIIGPGLNSLPVAILKRHGSNLAPLPPRMVPHHRQHPIIVEAVSGQEFQIALQPLPVVLAPPQCREVRNTQPEKRTAIIHQRVPDHFTDPVRRTTWRLRLRPDRSFACASARLPSKIACRFL